MTVDENSDLEEGIKGTRNGKIMEVNIRSVYLKVSNYLCLFGFFIFQRIGRLKEPYC